jgi:hypothetical protein
MSFGAPLDPAYISFRDGYLRAVDDFADQSRWRWSPHHEHWYVYSQHEWILDDIGIGDTAGTWVALNNASATSADLHLPPVFRAVSTQYRRYVKRWPGLVWTFRNGGDWREALSRNPKRTPGPGTGKGLPPTPALPAQALAQITQVQEYVAKGLISVADGQRLIRDIVAKWTLGDVDDLAD